MLITARLLLLFCEILRNTLFTEWLVHRHYNRFGKMFQTQIASELILGRLTFHFLRRLCLILTCGSLLCLWLVLLLEASFLIGHIHSHLAELVDSLHELSLFAARIKLSVSELHQLHK